MDIVLNRLGGVSVRDQLVTQLELQILSGTLRPGDRLPSVRALARRLKIHHNTVSAAYQDLEGAGHVRLQRGSGVYVRSAGPSTLPEARGLDEMIRLALHAAFRKGYSGPDIRAAVERWLAAAPPTRVVVVDPAREMAELLVHELREALGIEAACVTPDAVARDPGILAGALTLVLPYHLENTKRLAPSASVEALTIEASTEDRAAMARVPPGSIVLVVSHAPTVLPFATVLLRTLRGDEVLVEARPLAAAREWRRLLPGADLVFADALAGPVVARSRPRRLREFRVVPRATLERLRDALTIVVPGR